MKVNNLNVGCTIINHTVPIEALEREAFILNKPHLFPKNDQDFLWGVYPARNTHFAGREKELKQLTSSLQLYGSEIIVEKTNATQACAVLGLGGIGKTQLAAEYIWRLTEVELQRKPEARSYALILWLQGEPSLIDKDIRSLAEWLGFSFEQNKPTRELVSLVFERLKRLSLPNTNNSKIPRVLLVLDGADDCEVLKDYLPNSNETNAFHWLLTSRQHEEWKRYFNRQMIACVLGSFSHRDALEYLKKALNEVTKLNADTTDERLKALAKALGHLPLALAQAVAYINQYPEMSVAQYTQHFEHQTKLLGSVHVKDEYERTILTTWLIVLPKIVEKSPEAVELLLLCSYLSGESIPKGLLRAYRGDVKNDDVGISIAVNLELGVLQNYSLIEIDPKHETLRQHSLLQKVLRLWNKGQLHEIVKFQPIYQIQEEQDLLSRLLDTLLNYSEEQAPTMKDRERRQALIPHFKQVIKFYEKDIQKNLYDNKRKAELLRDGRGWLGLLYLDKGDYEKALESLKALWGSDEPQSNGTFFHALADFGCNSVQDGVEVKRLLERTLRANEERYGLESVELVSTLVSLGNEYFYSGEMVNAQELFEKALRIAKQHHGLRHIKVAPILVSLGNVYRELDNLGKARDLLEEALEIFQSHYGVDHLKLGPNLESLGNTYRVLKNAALAERFLQWSLKIKKQYYGKTHVSVAATLASLGSVYHDLDDVTKGKEVLEEALKILQQHYGSELVDETVIRGGWKSTYYASSEWGETKQLLSWASKILKQDYGSAYVEKTFPLLASSHAARLTVGFSKRAMFLCKRAFSLLLIHYGEHHSLAWANEFIQRADQLASMAKEYPKVTFEEPWVGIFQKPQVVRFFNSKSIYGFLMKYRFQPEKALKKISVYLDDVGWDDWKHYNYGYSNRRDYWDWQGFWLKKHDPRDNFNYLYFLIFNDRKEEALVRVKWYLRMLPRCFKRLMEEQGGSDSNDETIQFPIFKK